MVMCVVLLMWLVLVCVCVCFVWCVMIVCVCDVDVVVVGVGFGGLSVVVLFVLWGLCVIVFEVYVVVGGVVYVWMCGGYMFEFGLLLYLGLEV